MTFIEHIWSHDPPYDLKGEFWNIRSRTRSCRSSASATCRSRTSSGGPPISISLASPSSPSAAHRRASGLGHHLGQHHPDLFGGDPLAGLQQGLRRAGHRRPRRQLAGRAQRDGGAIRPGGARPRVRREGSNRYFFTYIRDVLNRVGILLILKPRPDMSDEEATPEAILKECVIYGSPKTVLDKLVAFREHVGPFGTLLMTGLDWGGPNEAWERESMRLLAHEVMPKFRQHVTRARPRVTIRAVTRASQAMRMTTMKAVRLFEFGGPEKLVYGDHPMPQVGPGDVLVKVLGHLGVALGRQVPHRRGARVLRQGHRPSRRHPRPHARFPMPMQLGRDAAGEVAAVGERVTTLEAGRPRARPDQSGKPALARQHSRPRQSVRRRRPARPHHVRRLRAVRRAAGELLDQDRRPRSISTRAPPRCGRARPPTASSPTGSTCG